MLRLNELLTQKLEIAETLVVFFGLPEQEQIVLLPVLEERKYNFPDGDLATVNALEVLVKGYHACLNAILNQLLIVQYDQPIEDDPAVDLVEQLWHITHKIAEEYFEGVDFEEGDHVNSFEGIEWESLRQLSSTIERKLGIQVIVNSTILDNCIEYWLHP